MPVIIDHIVTVTVTAALAEQQNLKRLSLLRLHFKLEVNQVTQVQVQAGVVKSASGSTVSIFTGNPRSKFNLNLKLD